MVFAGEKVTTALDISDNYVKIVAIARGAGKESLHVLDSARAAADNDRDIAKEMRTLISRHRLNKSSILASFPRHLVTVRDVRLPAANEEEIKNMAELQAVKHLPYSQEEIVVAHKTISAAADGYTDILLILAQRKSVNRYVEIFKHAGIHAEKLVLSSEGIATWYSWLGITELDAVAVIDFDRYHVHVLIAKGGILLFSRSVSFDSTAADSDKNILLREIRLSFDSYLKEKEEKICRIILTGSEDYAKDYSIFLRDNVPFPCEYVGQLSQVKVKDGADKFQHQLNKASFTHLLGIASRPKNLSVDLLPRDIVAGRKEQAVKNELVKTAILALAVAVAAFAVIEKKMIEKKAYLKKIEVRLNGIEPEVRRLTKLKDHIELIEAQKSFTGSALDIIREIYKILPKNISLTLFEFEDKNRILLRGMAKELSEVFDLLPQLEKSTFFENVRVNYANKRTFKNTEIVDFEIICALR